MTNKVRLVFLSFMLVYQSISGMAEEISTDTTGNKSVTDSAAIANDTIIKPVLSIVDTTAVIPKLDFDGIGIADALTALGRAYNLSLLVDASVTGTISMRLESVLLSDALEFIIKEYGLKWERTGGILKIYKPIEPEPEPEQLDITYEGGNLSFDLKQVPIDRFVNSLIEITGRNVILEGGARGVITAKIKNLPFDQALSAILPANGFNLRETNNILYIEPIQESDKGSARRRRLNIRFENGLVSIDISNSSLSDVISALAVETGASIFVVTKLEENISATFTDKTLEEALTFMLMNSKYTFNEINGVYFVGPRESEDLHTTTLIQLDHLVATDLETLLPVSLTKQLSIKVVPEHNGLAVTGPKTSIARLKSFVKELDISPAQVLFEVIVVDYTTTDRAEFGITANNFGGDSGIPGNTYYPDIEINRTGPQLNKELRSLERHLGVSNLGTLSDDFYLRLRMMQQEGKANIRSHPKIAALNGHSASIQIGQSQYYLLESQTIYPSQQTSVSTQTSQRFEIIEADMKLEVTPWVNRSGELIVDVNPEFNTPAESFNPDIPPTINHRVLKSTVRLRDGETIVLGGLVQKSESVTIDKVPLLGSIPIIGRIFQNRRSTDIHSELMVYVTPHIYYGSEGNVDIEKIIGK